MRASLSLTPAILTLTSTLPYPPLSSLSPRRPPTPAPRPPAPPPPPPPPPPGGDGAGARAMALRALWRLAATGRQAGTRGDARLPRRRAGVAPPPLRGLPYRDRHRSQCRQGARTATIAAAAAVAQPEGRRRGAQAALRHRAAHPRRGHGPLAGQEGLQRRRDRQQARLRRRLLRRIAAGQ
jgi:hypothetical protein